MKKKIVVYQHRRNDNNEIFYIGIGKTKKRAFSKYSRNKWWTNIVKSVGYTIEIVEYFDDYEKAKILEIELIKKYGRKDLNEGTLVNLTDGGEGTLNRKFSEETKKKIGAASKGRKHTEEARRKMSEDRMGRKHTEEARRKMSAVQKGKTLSEELKEKMRVAHLGKTHTEETKRKIGKASKKRLSNPENHPMYGKTHSEETIDKISKANKERLSNPENHPMYGKTHSEETKKKISEVHKKSGLTPPSALGRKLKNEHKQKISEANSIKVLYIPSNTIFNSIKEAVKETNISRFRIDKHINNEVKKQEFIRII